MKNSRHRSRLVPGGERIFQRIYTRIGCEGRPPHFVVEYHPYADLTHTIRLREDTAYVRVSDLLRDAPRHVFPVELAIDHDLLERRIEAAELRPPHAIAPAKSRLYQQIFKIASIQTLEHRFQIVVPSRGMMFNSSATPLPNNQQSAPR